LTPPHDNAPGTTFLALLAFLVFLSLQRLWELRVSARHTQAVVRRGAVEYGRRHFPLLVILHTLYPLALAAEVLVGGARPGWLSPVWFLLLVAAQEFRYAAIRALGEHWNVWIWVVPATQPIRRFIYRYLRHPNYLAVVIELFSGAMMFGAWRTALVISALNLAVLRIRVTAEDRALAAAAGAAPGPEGSATPPGRR